MKRSNIDRQHSLRGVTSVITESRWSAVWSSYQRQFKSATNHSSIQKHLPSMIILIAEIFTCRLQAHLRTNHKVLRLHYVSLPEKITEYCPRGSRVTMFFKKYNRIITPSPCHELTVQPDYSSQLTEELSGLRLLYS